MQKVDYAGIALNSRAGQERRKGTIEGRILDDAIHLEKNSIIHAKEAKATLVLGFLLVQNE